MDNKIGIGAIVLTAFLSLVAGGYVIPQGNSVYDCSNGMVCVTPYSISGGQGTRCYLDENKTSWDTCSTGWKLNNTISATTKTIELNRVKLVANLKEWECETKDGWIDSYTKCLSPDGREAYLGEKI